MSDDTQKRLKLMRYWLFGIFLIVFAATAIFAGMWTGPYWLQVSWPVWLVTAILCIIVGVGYQYWLTRKK